MPIYPNQEPSQHELDNEAHQTLVKKYGHYYYLTNDL